MGPSLIAPLLGPRPQCCAQDAAGREHTQLTFSTTEILLKAHRISVHVCSTAGELLPTLFDHPIHQAGGPYTPSSTEESKLYLLGLATYYSRILAPWGNSSRARKRRALCQVFLSDFIPRDRAASSRDPEQPIKEPEGKREGAVQGTGHRHRHSFSITS